MKTHLSFLDELEGPNVAKKEIDFFLKFVHVLIL